MRCPKCGTGMRLSDSWLEKIEFYDECAERHTLWVCDRCGYLIEDVKVYTGAGHISLQVRKGEWENECND